MEEKVIKAIPRHGTWEALYERVKKARGEPVWMELKVTPELFEGLRNYDLIYEAKRRKFLAIEGRLDEVGNVRMEMCVQQNNGDGDGFGVEPDDYMCGVIGPDGIFVKPFCVE